MAILYETRPGFWRSSLEAKRLPLNSVPSVLCETPTPQLRCLMGVSETPLEWRQLFLWMIDGLGQRQTDRHVESFIVFPESLYYSSLVFMTVLRDLCQMLVAFNNKNFNMLQSGFRSCFPRRERIFLAWQVLIFYDVRDM